MFSLQYANKNKDKMKLIFSKTNYLHHIIMNNVWQKLDEASKWKEIDKYKSSLHPQFATSFGVQVAVITKDNYLVIAKRSNNNELNKNIFLCSLTKGSNQEDIDPNTQILDIFSTAHRGLKLDLGIDVNKKDIRFLTLFSNFEFFHVGFFGYIDMRSNEEYRFTFNEVQEMFKDGVEDKQKTYELIPVKFELNEMKNFLLENTSNNRIKGAILVGIIHLMIKFFGSDNVGNLLK